MPPTPKPKPVCVVLTVTPKTIIGDGKPDVISVKVTAAKKSVAGVKVLVTGNDLRATGRSNANGMVRIKVNLNNPGLLRVTALGRKYCGSARIGVVGVFLPPLTG